MQKKGEGEGGVQNSFLFIRWLTMLTTASVVSHLIKLAVVINGFASSDVGMLPYAT